MDIKEWDEAPEPEKLHFGDTVRTLDGIEGKVTELEGEQYHVYNVEEVGWFTREELTLVK